MITRQRRQSFLSRLWMPMITAAFLGYFGYHAFTGFYGIQSMDRLEADAARLSAELGELELEHQEFERRVEMLRTDNLDADMVDIEARSALNRLRPDEVVIMLDTAQQNAN
jgi:cell division protein FtsB